MNDLIHAAYQITLIILGLGGTLGISWLVVGRKIHNATIGEGGWFHRIDKRFDSLELNQTEAKTSIGNLSTKVDTVISEQKDMRKEVTVIREGQYLDRERIARLEGRRDTQVEAAQLANAVGNVANAITHPRENPHETTG